MSQSLYWVMKDVTKNCLQICQTSKFTVSISANIVNESWWHFIVYKMSTEIVIDEYFWITNNRLLSTILSNKPINGKECYCRK